MSRIRLNEKPLVRAMRLGKSYFMGTEIKALHDASFEIYEGEFVVIVGQSGSGKTTLLSLMGGLEIPTQGDVIVNGQSMRHLNESGRSRMRKENVGFVFQFFNLINSLPAAENVAVPLRLVGLPEKEIKRKVKDLLKQINLEHRAHHLPLTLSGGEQQRVAIARALANQPKLVLADEPTGNLDTENSRDILMLLQHLNREKGVTFVIVTHDLSMRALADRIIYMKDGVVDRVELQDENEKVLLK